LHKNLLYISLPLFLLFLSTGASGQTTIGDVDPTTDNPILSQPHGTNMISCDAYGSIKYKGP
jgi:hypothetical protein